MEFKLVLFVSFPLTLVGARRQIDTVFNNPNSNNNNNFDDDDNIPGFEPVEFSTRGSRGPIPRCGEGKDLGVHNCVPYHLCHSKSKPVIKDGKAGGFGMINISSKKDTPCDSYLDVCCKVPKQGTNPNNPLEPPLIDPVDPFDPVPPPYTDDPIGPHPDPLPTTPKPIPKYCGIRNENGIDFKITGARDNEAEYGEFPWMVAILDRNDNPNSLLLCGGSLIALNIVLTAAHCVHGLNPNNLRIRVGEWDTQTTNERLPYQERNVYEIIIHPEYEKRSVINDVALLVLDRDVKRAEHIGTVCLPPQGELIQSEECYVTGWGKDVFGKKGRYQSILKKIELPTVPKRRCQDALRETRMGTSFVLHNSFMCAGGKENKDACRGDGGSPLVCPDPHDPTRYVQAGIVSWGIGCGSKNIPGVYADVTLYRNWIDRHMNIVPDSYIRLHRRSL